ncbi:glycosyltransferase family 4 protein (plasmid) [Lactococcus garvieae]|uniref:Glycosyltransferase n=3 Tax=Lactococcus TaxID=1357 RepID=F9VC50_LACGL|nr:MULTISPECIES: glycosyltransferase family 4 protein [Lactococcus]MDG4978299.1 glycosyltransferase family 4 protein [Lactococcus lactis]MDG5048356.1 glycosyltransferase family 4 protein [Lactococcus lactis]BAK59901.1 glycosyltransferase [Lactococcus garvieae Lg2]BAZ95811.1 glycosyltransferase [Lactococcus garvieae]BBA21983.1 glycosyltransferase [Lactococcus garvieae]
MRKKIMIVRNGPYPVDINAYNDQFIGLARAFAKVGYDSDIFYYSKKDENTIDISVDNAAIRVYNTRGIRVLRTGIYPKLLSKKFQNKYDLIITTEYSQIMTFLFSFSHIPVILYTGPYYNLFKLPFLSPIYDLLFTKRIDKKMKKILTKSELTTEFLTKKGYHNITTVGVGQDVDRFSENVVISKKAKKLSTFMENNNCILTVGSIDSRKNFPFILDVMEKLIKKDNSYTLICIGTGDEKFISRELLKHSEQLRERIIFPGKFDNRELKNIYPKAKIFIHPAKLEIFGMVLLEAMYFGTIVLSSPNGGSTTLIKNGENGYVLDIDNVDNWVKKIVEIDNNRELKSKIISNAKKTIESDYTWDNIVKYFLNK